MIIPPLCRSRPPPAPNHPRPTPQRQGLISPLSTTLEVPESTIPNIPSELFSLLDDLIRGRPWLRTTGGERELTVSRSFP